MFIICVICRDALIPMNNSDEVFFTNCGHVFHLKCIKQWLGRASTCPHCRETMTEDKIHKAYFTYLSDETSSNVGENFLLQERFDSLQFQILLKDKNIQNLAAKNMVLKKQNAGLRQEVRIVESEIDKKNSTIYDLKEKIKHLNELSSKYKILEEQFSKTKKKLDEFQKIKQTLSVGTLKNVMKIVQETKNPEFLINYICVMKKIMIKKEDKITTLQSQLKFWEKEQTKKIQHFEQLLKTCNNKNLSLQSRIFELEELLKNSKQNCIIKSSSQRNSNNHSFAISQPEKNTYSQTDTKQETENQNNLPSPPWIEVVMKYDMNEKKRTLNTTLDEYPSCTKNAKLCLQSGNNSDEINNTITDDVGNISNMNKQSKKKKKVKNF